MRSRLGLVGLAAVLVLTACTPRHSAAPTPTDSSAPGVAGHYDRTIHIGQRDRTYHVYVPAGLTGPAPLVLMLHGGFGDGAQAESSYGWDAQADSGHFVVAYPDGVDRAWNVGGGCCGIPGDTGIDDVAFVKAMVAAISASMAIDARRVYATGISNGGLLDYRLACDTDLFAAIGPDSATLLGACPSPAPVSVIHIHGTADHNIPYGGGPGDGPGKIDGPSVQSVVATWRQVDHCADAASTVQGQVTTSVASCPGGRAVELITIAGAGHQWPGSPPKPVIQKLLGLDAPSTALDATAVIWQFFAAHPKQS
jgi:polyhydroxybutyrate depolymerase